MGVSQCAHPDAGAVRTSPTEVKGAVCSRSCVVWTRERRLRRLDRFERRAAHVTLSASGPGGRDTASAQGASRRATSDRDQVRRVGSPWRSSRCNRWAMHRRGRRCASQDIANPLRPTAGLQSRRSHDPAGRGGRSAVWAAARVARYGITDRRILGPTTASRHGCEGLCRMLPRPSTETARSTSLREPQSIRRVP